MTTFKHFMTWVLLAIASNTLADELKVTDFSIMPGEQQDVAVELINPDHEYIMTEFWMSLPEGVTIAKDEDGELMYEENSARLRKSHSLTVAENSTNNTYHFLIYSGKNETLKGTSGALFTLTLQASAEVPQGVFTGRLFDYVFSDPNNTQIYLPESTFKVTVGNSGPVEDIEVSYDNDYPIPVWRNAYLSISEDELIGLSVSYELGMTSSEFASAYTLDVTSGVVNQYLRNGLTESVGEIKLEDGHLNWTVGDWQTVAQHVTGATTAGEALEKLRGNEGKGLSSGKGYTTYIRYKRNNGQGGDVYVELSLVADQFQFLTGSVNNKDLMSWYALNSTQRGSMELHLSTPTPTEIGSNFLSETDFQRELSNNWTQDGPKLTVSDKDIFLVADNEYSVGYRFTLPKKGENEAFSASSDGTWTVTGYSGHTYTLHLGDPIQESNGEVSYQAIYTEDNICIARITGNLIQYQSNDSSDDILNHAGRYDADGYSNSSYMDSGQTFAAYLELYAKGNMPPYGILMKDNLFNVRFQRPISIWSNNMAYVGNVNVNVSKLLNVMDWRNFMVDLNMKMNSNSQKVGYGFYGISSVTTDMNSIMTDLGASAGVRDEIPSKLSNRSLTQADIAGVMGSLSSASSISSLTSELGVSDAMVNALPQSVITFTDNGAVTQKFHLFVPVTLKYLWGNVKTWAVITVEPEQTPTDEPVTPPANLKTETFYVTGQYDVYNGETNDWEPNYMGGDVQIGFDGSTIYMQGFNPWIDGVWVKGTRSGNKVTFPKNQYLGNFQGFDMYFVGYNVETDEIVDVVLNYNSQTGEYTLADNIVILDNVIKDKFNAVGYWFELLISQTFKTIYVENAGTLSDQISNDEKYKLTGLKLFGNINGADFRLLRDMAGNDYQGNITQGQLARLDMENVGINTGGGNYLDAEWIKTSAYSSFNGGTCQIESPTVFGNSVFAGCRKLQRIVLPKSIEEIGDYALEHCTTLTEVIMPEGLVSIGSGAFMECKALNKIDIPESVQIIDRYAFAYCSNLTDINWHEGLEIIGDNAFYKCTSLAEVNIPNGVSKLGMQAFEQCSNLVRISIPARIQIISSYAFMSCTSLKDVYSYSTNPPAINNPKFRSTLV